MPRNNILLRRFSAPKRVQIANDCVFFAKYQRVGRHALAPTRVRIAKTYARKIVPRQQKVRRIYTRNRWKRKQSAGAGRDLSTAIDFGRKAARSKFGKMMINDDIRLYSNSV